MEQKDIAVLTERIKHIDERITELSDDYSSIKKSYNVLNDHHHQLEVDIVKLDTKISTCVNLVKWLISPAMILALLLELARVGGIIN